MEKRYYFFLIPLNVFDGWAFKFQLSITAYKFRRKCSWFLPFVIFISFFLSRLVLFSGQCIVKNNFIF